MIFLKKILIFIFGVLLTLLYGNLEAHEDAEFLKIRQYAYKLRDLRADVGTINKKYVNKFEVKTFKFNRTVTAFNFTFSFKYDLNDKFDVIIQAYKRASNEYRLFPMRVRANWCKLFKNNVFGLRNALKCGNFTTCTFKKNVVYHVCNFVADETRFPPLIPNGEYKSEITGMNGDEEVVVLYGYAEIYVPIKIP